MAKVIMVQGTMSNAGKSLVAAALCRIFKEDGYRVAPFKSQNMALNSYITQDGLEIGRAQAVQAKACGIKPTVYMNPILLKPTTDVGSQVIVLGKSIGNMRAKDYFAYKKELIPTVLEAYNTLAKDYDIIVIEGAGSPAEINLKQDDIVNMGLAKMLNAPVLLVGDIDRGGVFAQLFGTVALLEEEEQQHIAGLIINKFRGDASILKPGIEMIEEKCKKTVVGVLPYLDVDIEEEDSLSSRFERTQKETGSVGQIKVYIVKLPRISNYTDFAPLEMCDALDVHYVSHYREIKQPDWIILPGSKSTISDMLWLRESGFEAVIQKHAQKGCLVTGICGGYQMLGRSITDVDGIENENGNTIIEGMGLLDITTEFEEKKVTTQSTATIIPVGPFDQMEPIIVQGYEIHMGRSTVHSGATFLEIAETGGTRQEGCVQNNVFGTYMHGIFENSAFLEYIINMLCKKKNIVVDHAHISYEEYTNSQYQLLADEFRKHLDMEAIYHILNEGTI